MLGAPPVPGTPPLPRVGVDVAAASSRPGRYDAHGVRRRDSPGGEPVGAPGEAREDTRRPPAEYGRHRGAMQDVHEMTRDNADGQPAYPGHTMAAGPLLAEPVSGAVYLDWGRARAGQVPRSRSSAIAQASAVEDPGFKPCPIGPQQDRRQPAAQNPGAPHLVQDLASWEILSGRTRRFPTSDHKRSPVEPQA